MRSEDQSPVRRLRSSHSPLQSSGQHSSEASARRKTEQNISRASDTSCTPYMNKNISLINFQLPSPSNRVGKRGIKKLKLLLNKSWNIAFVSPLFNWNCNEISLKRYERLLRTAIVSKSDSESTHYKVSYTVIPELKLCNSDDPAIELRVFRTANGDSTLAYFGILLSWGVDENYKPSGSTFLPLLFWRGTSYISKLVHNKLQEIHDCVVSQKYIEDNDMRCLVVGCFATLSALGDGDLKFSWSTPKLTKFGQVVVTLPLSTLTLLWKCVHRSETEKWSEEEVHVMWEDIHSHIHRSFGINPDYFLLRSVELPHMALSKTSINVKGKEEMNLILCYLMAQCPILEDVTPTLQCAK